MVRQSTTPSAYLQSLLYKASQDARERIRRDRRQAQSKLKPLLSYLESHLFDPDLNVNRWKIACGVRDNSLAITFHVEIGYTPRTYIADRRFETATRLLCDTDLYIWQISQLLGFSTLTVFSKAFSRWAGELPSAYRKRPRQTTAVEAASKNLLGERQLRQALSGALPTPEAQGLIWRLLDLYPQAHPEFPQANAAPPLFVSGLAVEQGAQEHSRPRRRRLSRLPRRMERPAAKARLS